MSIRKNGNAITAEIEGKLDRSTSPDFEKEINAALTDDVRLVTMDLAKTVYISSAGLRVILAVEKKMNKNGGKLVIKNVPPLVMEVFTETGLTDILTLE